LPLTQLDEEIEIIAAVERSTFDRQLAAVDGHTSLADLLAGG
jgi:hypothetical protein